MRRFEFKGIVITIMFSLLLSGCSGITDRVNTVKENVNDVKETVESAKEGIESATEAINGAKEMLETIDLENLTIEDLNLDESFELPEELLAVLEENGVVLDTDAYGDKIVGGDIISFGKYKVKELIYESETPEDEMTIEYKTTASYDEVVAYFDGVLKGTDDYSTEDHYDTDLIYISGLFDDRYVKVMIDDSDEDQEVYVIFGYEYTSDQGEEGPETANNADIDFNSEEIQTQQNEAIKTINPGSEIIIRKEIGEFSFEELKEDFDQVYYPRDMVVSIEGTSTDSETGTDAIAYDVFFKDGNMHMASYFNGDHVSVSIYNHVSDTTCTYTTAYPAFKEVLSGNVIPLRLLDLEMFEQLEADDDVIPIYLEQEDGSRYIWMNTQTSSFMYSFDERMIQWYHEHWSDSEGSYVIDWHVVHTNYNLPIDDGLFEW